MKREVLCRPFPADAIKQRKGHNGQMLRYVDVAAVIARLNEGCDRWDFEVTQYEVRDGDVVVLGRLVADGVVKSAFGGSSVTLSKQGEVVSLADDLKAASSDALKKAASLLGVGLELYGGRSEVPKVEARSPQERATVRQLHAIQAASRRQGFSQDRLAAFLVHETGKREPSLLTRSEASSVIKTLSETNGAAH